MRTHYQPHQHFTTGRRSQMANAMEFVAARMMTGDYTDMEDALYVWYEFNREPRQETRLVLKKLLPDVYPQYWEKPADVQVLYAQALAAEFAAAHFKELILSERGIEYCFYTQ